MFFRSKNVEAKGHSKDGICIKHCKIHMIMLFFKKSKKRKNRKIFEKSYQKLMKNKGRKKKGFQD